MIFLHGRHLYNIITFLWCLLADHFLRRCPVRLARFLLLGATIRLHLIYTAIVKKIIQRNGTTLSVIWSK